MTANHGVMDLRFGSISRDPRAIVAAVLGVSLVAAALGGALGFGLQTLGGYETVTVLAIPFTVSLLSFAAYAGVSVGTFLVTLALVFVAVEHLEDEQF